MLALPYSFISVCYFAPHPAGFTWLLLMWRVQSNSQSPSLFTHSTKVWLKKRKENETKKGTGWGDTGAIYQGLWKKWQPIPVFLPGESHGQRSPVGYSPWGCKQSDMTKHTFTWSSTYYVRISMLLQHRCIVVFQKEIWGVLDLTISSLSGFRKVSSLNFLVL